VLTIPFAYGCRAVPREKKFFRLRCCCVSIWTSYRRSPRVQVFATDIDDRALSVARAARYPEALLDSVSAERRKRFFILDGGSYVVSKDVRELCIFSPHSVVRDPPFSRIDLVSCRNLLIYFGADVQNQVIPTFHYALRPDGYLFLGSAENVSQFAELFVPIEKKHRIFRRRSNVTSSIRLPILINTLKPGQLSELVPRRPPLSGLLLRQTVDEYVLDRFSPAHVVHQSRWRRHLLFKQDRKNTSKRRPGRPRGNF